jgi:hypothetical protein
VHQVGVNAPLRPCRHRDPERGAVAVLAAIMLLTLCTFFALAFSLGQMMDTRTELQAASDSAALAGARSLNGEASGLVAARAAASYYTGRHRGYDEMLRIDEALDVTFGRWHFQASQCTHGTSGSDCFEVLDETEPRLITAVRVRNGRDGGSHNDPLPLEFGGFFTTNTARINSQAVAVGGGTGAPECALPLALPECRILDDANQLRCGEEMTLTFANATTDGIGFINLYYPDERSAANPNFVEEEIRNSGCRADDRHVVGEGKLLDGNALVNRIIQAMRGVDFNGSGNSCLNPGGGQGNGGGGNNNGGNGNGNGGPNATSPDCIIGTVQTLAVVEEGCPINPYFHGVQSVVGYVNVRIINVLDNQGCIWTCGPQPTGPHASGQRGITVRIECDERPGDGRGEPLGGGRVYNSDARLRLVQ